MTSSSFSAAGTLGQPDAGPGAGRTGSWYTDRRRRGTRAQGPARRPANSSFYNQVTSNMMRERLPLHQTQPNLGPPASAPILVPALGSSMSALSGGGPSLAAAQYTGSGGGNAITIDDTFPTPPPDPHTFVQGVSFEIQAASP